MLGYVWALPVTLFGLLFVPLAFTTGGGVRFVRGAVEVYGGVAGRLLRRGLPFVGPAAAVTIGHVIVGRDFESLESSRDHEHVHIRQFELWGEIFPAH
jgi:hypothetical protein